MMQKGDVFVCLLCNAEIKRGNNKKRHKKICKKRPGQTIFLCNICFKQFSYKSTFNRLSQIYTRVIFSCINYIIVKVTNILPLVLNSQPWWMKIAF